MLHDRVEWANFFNLVSFIENLTYWYNLLILSYQFDIKCIYI